MQLFIGSDHRGFEKKRVIINWALSLGYKIEDCGNKLRDPRDDYPDFAKNVAQKVVENPRSFGILLCGSGVGISIAANRYSGVRAALGFDPKQVEAARKEDDVNILVIPADYLDAQHIHKLLTIFLKTKFLDGDTYKRRIKKIDILP